MVKYKLFFKSSRSMSSISALLPKRTTRVEITSTDLLLRSDEHLIKGLSNVISACAPPFAKSSAASFRNKKGFVNTLSIFAFYHFNTIGHFPAIRCSLRLFRNSPPAVHTGAKIHIHPKILIFKITCFKKFTFSESLFNKNHISETNLSQKSHIQNILFHKNHNFKISFFTKFTLFHIWTKSVIFPSVLLD